MADCWCVIMPEPYCRVHLCLLCTMPACLRFKRCNIEAAQPQRCAVCNHQLLCRIHMTTPTTCITTAVSASCFSLCRYIVRISFVWAALQGCHDVRVNGTVTLTSNNATTNTSASPAVNLAAAPPPLAVAPSNVTAATRKEAAQVSSQSVSSTPQVGRCGVAKLCFQLLQCH